MAPEDDLIEALAEAWDRGFSAGESFANWGSDNTANPYRVKQSAATS